MCMPPSARKSLPQHVLTVVSTERLGRHLVRVELTGETLADFGGHDHTDSYVKLLFVDPELDLEPPHDVAALRATLPPAQQPVTRTYTVRRIDRGARRLVIDFVTHGDTGHAGPWAAGAQSGDVIQLMGPGGGYAPDVEARWHLLAGDLSALPAVATALEAMPPQAQGVALIEVETEADIVPLTTQSQVDVQWLVNPHPGDVDFLARAIESHAWPQDVTTDGAIQVFVHGERESVKAVRAVLKGHDIPRGAISISGYWARGRTEDAFQAEKRTPIGQIED